MELTDAYRMIFASRKVDLKVSKHCSKTLQTTTNILYMPQLDTVKNKPIYPRVLERRVEQYRNGFIRAKPQHLQIAR